MKVNGDPRLLAAIEGRFTGDNSNSRSDTVVTGGEEAGVAYDGELGKNTTETAVLAGLTPTSPCTASAARSPTAT